MQKLIATGFGVGLIPRRLFNTDNGAGTFGAALAALVGLALWTAPWWIDLLVALVAMGLSLWAAAPFAEGNSDPNWVVIDEVAGTLVAFIGLQDVGWLVALVVARLGDIFKVLPGVPQAERLPGAVGITADDVVAGLYGLVAGWTVTGLI
ncbi:MAG: phosphatidylglycerophosphatase A [Acidimicrobiia bacterium]|nr:phosphatidylglycerophosphatase A [Acidimicrobiia bacterium]